MSSKVQVFDPPMCCSTGVCGPVVDPVLPRFAADLAWLAGQGFAVERFNLSQQPAAFVENALVREALHERGNDCLPLILLDGRIVSDGGYPTRAALAERAGLKVETEVVTVAEAACAPKSADAPAAKRCC